MARNINKARGYTTAEIMENGIENYPEDKIFYVNAIIKSERLSQLSKIENLTALLQKKIGRTVIIEYFNDNGIIRKIGKITEVGENYVLLKNKTRTVYCEISSIKFITLF